MENKTPGNTYWNGTRSPQNNETKKEAPVHTENREIARIIKTQQDKALREQSKPKKPKLDIPIEQQQTKINKRTQKCKQIKKRRWNDSNS